MYKRASFLILMPLLLCMSCSKGKKENKTVENQTPGTDELSVSLEQVRASKLSNLPSQKFKVGLDSTSFVVCKKGLVLCIQPESFVDENGNPVKGQVDLEVKEVVTMQDFFDSGISTMSDDKILQTAGSYFFEATQNGKPLKINSKGGGVFAAIPALQKDPDMRLFVGVPTSELATVNWKLDQNPEEDKIEPIEPIAPKELLDPNESLSKDEVALEKQIQFTEEFIKRIETEFTLQGDVYVKDYAGGRRETYKLSFYQRLKARLAMFQRHKKHFKEKRHFYRQKNASLIEAWKKYIEAWKKYSVLFEEIKSPNFYEYKLNERQWFNCDKFRNDILVKFAGKVLKPNNDILKYARVHLISEQEKIHLQTELKDGNFEFYYPEKKPFKVMVCVGKYVKEVEFDGKNTDLGTLVMEAKTKLPDKL